MSPTFLPLLLCLALPGAIPDLTPEQLRQLETATDQGKQLDEAALYALLQNVSAWPADAAPNAPVPDYPALRQDPARFRGEIYAVEGKLAARPRPVPRLARPGPWDGRLHEYGILVDPQTQATAVVYLVDPPTEADRPRVDQMVRIPARFFKVWRNQNRAGKEMDFLVFIGKGAQVVPRGGAASSVPTTSPGAAPPGAPAAPGLWGQLTSNPAVNGGALILLALVVYWLVRQRLRRFGSASGHSSIEERQEARRRAREEGDQVEDPGPPLPADPAAALDELERRRREDV